MSELIQPHGGHASDGYGLPKNKVPTSVMGLHCTWKKLVFGLMLFVP